MIAYFGCLILRIPIISACRSDYRCHKCDSGVRTVYRCNSIVTHSGNSESVARAFIFLIFIVVLQQVDGNIIGPKILGSSTGLSTFWVMFAILIGGGMFGFLGMLLGVPTFAVIYYIVRRVVNYALRKKKLPEDTMDYTKTTGVDTKNNKLKYE